MKKPGYTATTAGELMELRAHGLLAWAFMTRGVEPNENQWNLLRGGKEITLRDIGEIAFELDFEVDFNGSIKAPLPETVDSNEGKDE